MKGRRVCVKRWRKGGGVIKRGGGGERENTWGERRERFGEKGVEVFCRMCCFLGVSRLGDSMDDVGRVRLEFEICRL